MEREWSKICGQNSLVACGQTRSKTVKNNGDGAVKRSKVWENLGKSGCKLYYIVRAEKYTYF